MKLFALCMLLAIAKLTESAVLTHIDGYVEKQVTFVGKDTVEETVTVQDEEVRFVVEARGLTLILDYANNKIVFITTQKMGVCFIKTFDPSLTKEVSLENIKEQLKSQRGREIKLETPVGKTKIDARQVKPIQSPVLGKLGTTLCKGLKTVEVLQTTAVSTVRENVREKREIGIGEVIVIIIIIIILF